MELACLRTSRPGNGRHHSHDKREEWTHANTVGELADGNLIFELS